MEDYMLNNGIVTNSINISIQAKPMHKKSFVLYCEKTEKGCRCNWKSTKIWMWSTAYLMCDDSICARQLKNAFIVLYRRIGSNSEYKKYRRINLLERCLAEFEEV